MEKLVLIDGNSLINRAFYATPVFTTKAGVPTNGVFGFVKLMLKIISDKQPTYFAVAFDLHAPTFRHTMYADYKAGRKPMPEELAVQMPILKEVLQCMQIKTLEMAGYEADDLLGTMAKKFDVQTYIYTGDRDSYQLVDDTTNVCYTRKGVSDILELSHENFIDEVGLTPSQIIDLKALMGDKSDNIPGVAGVGEKSALSLLARFQDVDGVYAHIGEITGALKTKLETGKENAYFSKTLATIDTAVPLDIELGECLLRMPFSAALKDKFAELEFKSLLALPIFGEGERISADEPVPSLKIEEVYPATIEEIVAALDEGKCRRIACDFSDREMRFVFLDEAFISKKLAKEYVLSIKTELLDPGFFDWQLQPLFARLFGENMRVIAYNVKAVMHRLNELFVSFIADYDDVAVLKYLADGVGNTDGVALCLSQNGLSENNRAVGVAQLYETYVGRLSAQELDLYEKVELPLVRVLYDMELVGVCVDEDTLGQLSVKYTSELNALTREIWAVAGEEFNIKSTQQLGKILFEKLKIGGEKKKKDGNFKTTADILEKYADVHPIVPLILRYRKIQKLHSTYIEGFKPLIKRGRVHTTYNQSYTSTGRLSSANPNLQNIPIRTDEGRVLRKLFKASAGNILLDADYSQIELRLLAHFSGCEPLVKAYCNGEDIHALTASQVFHTPLKEVTATQRREAKAVNFGIIYGISAFGLSEDLNITPKKAQEYIDRYFEGYVGIKEFMQRNVQMAKEKGYVTTLLGRRRVINELQSTNFNTRTFGERAAMNMPLQGSSADIIKIAMIHVANRLRECGFRAKLVLQIHDELVIDCPKDEADRVAILLKEEMERAVTLSVPLTVDVGRGESWFDSKA